MSETTEHGENIANDIQGEDAYGYNNDLTIADVWNILDNLHSKFMNQYVKSGGYPEREKDMTVIFSRWMDELEAIDEDLPI
jgi:hypothetical protein